MSMYYQVKVYYWAVGAHGQLWRFSPKWENVSNMGEKNVGPNGRFSPKWESTFCARLGVHLHATKVCLSVSLAKITPFHRLLQNSTVSPLCTTHFFFPSSPWEKSCVYTVSGVRDRIRHNTFGRALIVRQTMDALPNVLCLIRSRTPLTVVIQCMVMYSVVCVCVVWGCVQDRKVCKRYCSN